MSLGAALRLSWQVYSKFLRLEKPSLLPLLGGLGLCEAEKVEGAGRG